MEPLSYQQMNETSMELVKAYQEAAKVVIENYNKDPDANWQDVMNISEIFTHWMAEILQSPHMIWEVQSRWWQDYLTLLERYQESLLGKPVEPVILPHKRDKRFESGLWQEQSSFFLIQQLYLLFSKYCTDFIRDHKSKNPKIAQQVRFFTDQYLDAISPTNFILTNPQVLKKTVDTHGENLIEGYRHFLEDVIHGQGHFSIKMTDMSAFHVGKNLAVTPGKVIFENPLIQLIQYMPTTEKVYERPLLIIPPWINKYYILDLRTHNSLVKWIVDQGYTVFMISWVNPDKSYALTSFSDYMEQGVFAALDAIESATAQPSINALGFCVGGTLLATTLSYCAAKKISRIYSATFLTTLIDFSDPGEVGVFIDEKQFQALEKRMDIEGYLDGRLIMNTFNMLRSNDLMWSYYVNNYLCGQEPFPFDVLFWNCDSTNLPAAMHQYYLRHFYLDNELIQGALPILGEMLDIHNVAVPAYFISTEHDHIAPWKTTFIGAQAMQGPVTFVLGGSGHIAGIVNPPSNNKYGYKIAAGHPNHYATADDWYKASQQREGSWWAHWEAWLKSQSGALIGARTPGDKTPVLTDAPGDYVKKRIL